MTEQELQEKTEYWREITEAYDDKNLINFLCHAAGEKRALFHRRQDAADANADLATLRRLRKHHQAAKIREKVGRSVLLARLAAVSEVA